MAQVEEPEIVRQRSRALVWLAQRAGIEGPDAIETVEDGLALLWTEEPAAQPEPPPAEEPEPEPEAEREPEPQPEPPTERLPLVGSAPPPSSPPPASPSAAASLPSPKPFPTPRPKRQPKPKPAGDSNRRLLVLLALAAVAVVLFIVLTSGGSDDATSGGGAPPVASTTAKGTGKPTSGSVSMQMLPGVDISGKINVTTSGDPAQPKLDMKLEGLPDPDGEYRAWLYKSVIDSRSLGKARKGNGEIKATLPANWQDYPFVDVSIQQPGSIAHSGESITRISTEDLPQP